MDGHLRIEYRCVVARKRKAGQGNMQACSMSGVRYESQATLAEAATSTAGRPRSARTARVCCLQA